MVFQGEPTTVQPEDGVWCPVKLEGTDNLPEEKGSVAYAVFPIDGTVEAATGFADIGHKEGMLFACNVGLGPENRLK